MSDFENGWKVFNGDVAIYDIIIFTETVLFGKNKNGSNFVGSRQITAMVEATTNDKFWLRVLSCESKEGLGIIENKTVIVREATDLYGRPYKIFEKK